MINSLSVAKNFVADARRTIVAPLKPEDIILEDYNFVPFVRDGLSGAITADPGAGGVRAVVNVAFEVRGAGAASAAVARDLTLYGPGDIVGLDPAQIIRREPAPNTDTAEETFIAQIEFDRPDIPWLFSPVAPRGDRLDPWLALVVCERDRSKILPPVAPGLPLVLATELGELQSLEDNAYFAHAQVVGGPKVALPANPAIADRLSEEHALANLSRLICPRKLDPSTAYRAVLVPAFDCGARAGLGASGGTLGPAWTRAADGGDAQNIVQLPAYDSWEFATGPAGDFKSLAERLDPIAAPWTIGRRIIDGTQPGGGLAGATAGETGALQVLSCAVRSPATPPADGPTEAESEWPAPLRDALRLAVEAGNEDAPLLPRVGPRLYGRFQVGRNVIGEVFGDPPTTATAADANWFSQLNTAPRHRIVAGLGTRVVQKDQELLMQSAWAQVSEINKLNHQIQQHQFAKALNESNLKRRIAVRALGDLTQVTRPVHDRVRIAARPDSLWKQIEDSRTPGSILSITGRRLTDASAPAMRKGMAVRALAKAPAFVADNAEYRDQRLSYANPDGITAVSDAGLAVLGPQLVGKVLGVAPGVAFDTLRTKIKPLAAGTGIARLSRGAAAWNIDATRTVGGLFANYLTARIDVRVPNPADGAAVVRSELAGAALAGLAAVAVPEFRQVADGPIAALAAAVPVAVVRRDIAATVQPITRLGTTSTIAVAAAPVAARTTPSIAARASAADSVFTRRGPVVERLPVPPVAAPPPAAATPVTRFETLLSRDLTGKVSALSALKLTTLAQALDTTVNRVALPPARDAAAVPQLTATAAQILATIEPARTMTAYLKGRIRTWPTLIRPDWFDDQRIDPVMAAPVFPRAMYEALDAYDRDWLVPGLGSIVERDFVTLLEANPAFCEAFLVGASDEMGRELLWRNYPTDQRGTYFKRFWDAQQDELTAPIHRFSTQPLGAHMAIGGTSSPGFRPVVLVIRGALVKRYPEAIVAAVQSTDGTFPPTFVAGSDAEILFHAHLEPDYILVGFKLSVAEVKAGNWWFLIAEHPTAPRFGMAEAPPGNPRAPDGLLLQDKLDWNDLSAVVGGQPMLDRGKFLAPHARSLTIRDVGSVPTDQQWPGSSAVVARTLLRDPVRAAFPGGALLTSIESAGGPNA